MNPNQIHRMGSASGLAALVFLGLVVGSAFGPEEAAGQAVVRPERQLQVGVGAIPGLGLQTGYIIPRSFYTLEGVAYLYASPQFAGGEADMQLSIGLGGSFRPLGLVRLVGNTGYTGYDIDLGLRIGPGLTFAIGQEETLADKNKRFNLLFELFARLVTEINSGRTLFLEVGGHRPVIRAGLWIDF